MNHQNKTHDFCFAPGGGVGAHCLLDVLSTCVFTCCPAPSPRGAAPLHEVMTVGALTINLTFPSSDTAEPNCVTCGSRQGLVRCRWKHLSPSWEKSQNGLLTRAGASVPRDGPRKGWGIPRPSQSHSMVFLFCFRVTDGFLLPLPSLVGYGELTMCQGYQ